MAIGYGTEKEFQTSGISERVKVTPLDSTKFVVAYRDASDSGHGTCKVGTVSGSSITFGAETEFLSVTQVDWVWVAAISSTKFVVVYQDENASDEGYAVVGTVSGTGITFGTRSAFKTGGNVNNICVEMLTSTKVVITYRFTSGNSTGFAKIGTVTGTSIAFGTEAEFSAAHFAGAFRNTIAIMSSTVFVVNYTDYADSQHGTSEVGTVSGTNITFGAEYEFASAGAAWTIVVTPLSSTKFVVAYQDKADSQHGTSKVGTVSGTTITFGSESEFITADGAYNIDVEAMSSTEVIVVCMDNSDSDHGTSWIGTITGTDIVFTSEVEYLSVDGAESNHLAAMSSTVFVVAYRDMSDSGHGTARVGDTTTSTAKAAWFYNRRHRG